MTIAYTESCTTLRGVGKEKCTQPALAATVLDADARVGPVGRPDAVASMDAVRLPPPPSDKYRSTPLRRPDPPAVNVWAQLTAPLAPCPSPAGSFHWSRLLVGLRMARVDPGTRLTSNKLAHKASARRFMVDGPPTVDGDGTTLDGNRLSEQLLPWLQRAQFRDPMSGQD